MVYGPIFKADIRLSNQYLEDAILSIQSVFETKIISHKEEKKHELKLS